MADITMCGNSELCPERSKCYRATASPDIYAQSYADFFNPGAERCLHLITRIERVKSKNSQEPSMIHGAVQKSWSHSRNEKVDKLYG